MPQNTRKSAENTQNIGILTFYNRKFPLLLLLRSNEESTLPAKRKKAAGKSRQPTSLIILRSDQLNDRHLSSIAATDAGANNAGVAAVAFCVAETVRSAAPMVVLSTASPYKFPRVVNESLGLDASGTDFECMDVLAKATGTTAPAALRGLETADVRFDHVVDIDGMEGFVEQAAKAL